MREIRLSGSEGGGTESNRFTLPLSWRALVAPHLIDGLGRQIDSYHSGFSLFQGTMFEIRSFKSIKILFYPC